MTFSYRDKKIMLSRKILEHSLEEHVEKIFKEIKNLKENNNV